MSLLCRSPASPPFLCLLPLSIFLFLPAPSPANLAVSKEEQAREFLEELDIADEENVQALLSVGFKSKNRFLKTLPNLAEEDRKEILDELKAAMGRVDFLVLSKYLSRYC